MAAIFDGDNLLITLDAPTAGVLSQTAEQVYDDAKQWYLGGTNSRFPFPFLTSGGEDITATTIAGQYYFLQNDLGWRIRSTDESQNVYWDGNLIPVDPTLPIIIERAGRTVLQLGLQPLVTGISGLTPTIGTEVADIHGQMRRCVWVDTEAVINGNGYQQTPFNNWTDAVDYDEANGLTSIFLAADAVVDRQLKNFEITGLGGLPEVDINGQILDGSTFRLCNLTGTQGDTGTSLIAFDCQLTNIVDFNGAASLVGLVGTVAFANGGVSILNEAIPFVAGDQVTLSLTLGGASPTVVNIQNASGHFLITNMDLAGDVLHIAVAQGTVEIDASCTAGTVVITGSCGVINNSGGTTVDDTAVDHELVMSHIVENGETFEGQLRLIRAASAGNVVQQPDGSYIIKSADGAIDRITGDDAANNGRTISAVDRS